MILLFKKKTFSNTHKKKPFLLTTSPAYCIWELLNNWTVTINCQGWAQTRTNRCCIHWVVYCNYYSSLTRSKWGTSVSLEHTFVSERRWSLMGWFYMCTTIKQICICKDKYEGWFTTLLVYFHVLRQMLKSASNHMIGFSCTEAAQCLHTYPLTQIHRLFTALHVVIIQSKNVGAFLPHFKFTETLCCSLIKSSEL